MVIIHIIANVLESLIYEWNITVAIYVWEKTGYAEFGHIATSRNHWSGAVLQPIFPKDKREFLPIIAVHLEP